MPTPTQHKSNKRVTLTIIALVILLALLAYWRRPRLIAVNSPRIMMMGTFARIQLRCTSRSVGEQALTQALDVLDRLDHLISTYKDDSELSRANHDAADRPVPISPETHALLARALAYCRLTHGAFDITVGPLLQLWKEAAEEGRPPTPAELSAARSLVGYQMVTLSDRQEPSVSFARAGVTVNVNAIAKGYAVDQALAATRVPGVLAALVDIGGEIACFGAESPGRPWRVGIQDPFAAANDNPLSESARWTIQLRDNAVATSGNYRQYLSIGAQQVSHIVDPRTGQPAAKLPSVTIIAPKAEDADALATAVSVLGPEEGMELIESLDHVEALLIGSDPDNPRPYRSSGFPQHELPNR